MAKNTLCFSWNYVPLISPEKLETAPVLHIFPSATFTNANPRIMVRAIEDEKYTKQQRKNVFFLTQKNAEDACDAPDLFVHEKIEFCENLPRDATLNVDAYVHTYNDKGELCLSEAGCGSLYVYQVLEDFARQRSAKEIIVRRALQVYNVDDEKLVKGVVLFRFVKKDVECLKFDEPSEYDFCGGANKETYMQTFHNYVTANYSVFANTNARATWPFMQHIHSHLYAFRGLVVPGLAFVLLDGTKNTLNYYENLFYIALRRYFKYAETNEQLEQKFDAATDADVAKIMVLMCTAFSNYCNYMTDKAHTLPSHFQHYQTAADKLVYVVDSIDKKTAHEAHYNAMHVAAAAAASAISEDCGSTSTADSLFEEEKEKKVAKEKKETFVSEPEARRINDMKHVKLIESFSVWMRMTKTGDCEDMALEILRHLWDLSELDFSKNKRLQRMQQIRRLYVPLQTLKGVTSAAVTDDLAATTDMGAHMDITLVPRAHMTLLMRNFNTAAPLFENDEFDKTNIHGFNTTNLPVLICEGTGTLFPDATEDEAMGAKMYMMQNSSNLFANVKTMLHQPLDKGSSFYKTIQSALVHEYIAHGYGVGEVVFFQRNGIKLPPIQSEIVDFEQHKNKQACEHAVKKVVCRGNADSEKESLRRIARYDSIHPGVDGEHAVRQEMVKSIISTHNFTKHYYIPLANAIEAHSAASAKNAKILVSPKILQNQQRKLPTFYGSTTQYIEGDSAATYSIRHTDLIRKNCTKISIYTMPDVNKDEITRMKRVLAHNHPCTSLDISEKKSEHLKEVETKLADTKRAIDCITKKRNAAATKNFVSVDFYVKLQQLTDTFLDAVVKLCAKKQHVLDFFYHPEILCDNDTDKKISEDENEFGGYLLRFHCTPLRAVL